MSRPEGSCRVDLQVHSCWSYDGYMTLRQIDRAAQRRGLTAVAITDHNVVAGALRASELQACGQLQTRIIVGVEIGTTQGEIVGLFCRGGIEAVLHDSYDAETRVCRLSLAEAVAAIREDGGLVYLNHPFGYGSRSATLDWSSLEPLWDEIDLVEVFNGHNGDPADDRRALELAQERGKPGGVGSDAHSAWEVGRSYLEMAPFEDARSFVERLQEAKQVTRRRPGWYRWAFAARKRPPYRWLAKRPTPADDQRELPLPGRGVFVTNAGRRKAVPIVRSLGRAGVRVVAGESAQPAMAFRSRYVSARTVYPDPGSDPAAFLEHLRAYHAAHPFEQLYPLDDDVVEVVSRHRAELPFEVPLPDDEAVQTCLDKYQLAERCARLQLPHPRTVRLDDADDLGRAAELGYPLLAKPRRGMGSRGIVRLADPERAAAFVADLTPETYLAQELLPAGGAAYGYFALFDTDHRAVAEMMHRRLREFPLTGGPSTARVSVWEEPVAATGRRLLEDLSWTGVAMVEFKVDRRSGEAKVLEVNPRFWGSVALGMAAGVDFPHLLYRSTRGEALVPVTGELGVRSRWLFPGELLYVVAQLLRRRWPGDALAALFQRGWHNDLLDLDDPGPVWGFVHAAAARALDREAWRSVFRR